MAYFSAHVFDIAAQRRNRIQGDAGAVAPFIFAFDVGHLHSSDHASQTRSSSSSLIVGLFGGN